MFHSFCVVSPNAFTIVRGTPPDFQVWQTACAIPMSDGSTRLNSSEFLANAEGIGTVALTLLSIAPVDWRPSCCDEQFNRRQARGRQDLTKQQG